MSTPREIAIEAVRRELSQVADDLYRSELQYGHRDPRCDPDRNRHAATKAALEWVRSV